MTGWDIVGEGDNNKEYYLTSQIMIDGLQLMADKFPVHYADFMSENDDAATGDIFLQCCLFGEVIYE